ncbi:MAG: hypothetical protein Q7R41_17860 [Phycisphaerales bacterium]|nr:hypothetical protein [Phycisphaerales bacterium]
MEATAAETMAEPGQFSRGVGQALAPLAPSVVKKVLPTRISTPRLGQGNVAEAEAVAFGQSRGIPVDASTASSNRFVKATQQMSDRTPLGSLVAERATEQTAKAFQKVGGELADQTHPAPISIEQAGQGVRDAVTGKVKDFHAAATTQYERLRAIEADPARAASMQMDLTVSRDALRPIYLRLKREAELVPLQGGKARALVALDRLINGFTAKVPLSIVDEALGDLKALARGADIPELRTQGQGVAAEAVRVLDQQVQQTAARAGVDAFRALKEGRNATVQKYLAADVLDDLIRGTGDEPVRVTNRLTANQDSAIAKLREVQKLAPQELPKIGRAFLDALFEKAQQKGGFGRTDRLFSDWHNLGPETKRLLFKDPRLVKDLDNFFLLAERTNASINPSGTALTAASWSTGIGLMFYSPGTAIPLVITSGALSKLMHSPRAVKAFTRGLSMPVANRAGAAAVTSEILKVAGDAAVPLPTAAEGQSDQPRAIGQR